MKTAGYSGKTLLDKLGYNPGNTVFVHNGPLWFVDYLTHEGIIITSTLPSMWSHVFVQSNQELNEIAATLQWDMITKSVWLSWPKRSGTLVSNLVEQDLRDIILPLGWVDIKVTAINETWSGLKFNRRRLK